ncbi:MAG: efflux RND transporter periplasmic adaptor subunit, partial [Zoogloea sp.]|nr:efflux RND transporter periplasmic adaptor subunit [Zoogloea sp.]
MNNPAEKPQPVRPGRRKFNRRLLALLAVAVLGAGGYFVWQRMHGHGDGLEQYQLAAVQRGDIEDLVTATGTMQPREYVDVGAQVSGQLKKIHVEVGSVVNEGDLLAEIDPTVFRANVDARRAQVRNLRANLADREAQLALAQLQYARQKNLAAGDATTTDSLQTADAAVRSARAQVEAQRAQIEQNESTLRADEANLNYARIYAPMAGVVVSITARQGQTLNANQQAPTVLRIADLSTMTVQTQVSEADVSRLQPDMEVYFTTLGSRGRRWYGTLNKVEPTPTVTNNVVLYNALFDVANTQRNLLPQMTAQVFFVAATARDTLIVPASAVSMRRAGAGKGGRPAADEVPAAPKHDEAAKADEGSAAAPAQRRQTAGGRPSAAPDQGAAGRKAGQDGLEREAGNRRAPESGSARPQGAATAGRAGQG